MSTSVFSFNSLLYKCVKWFYVFIICYMICWTSFNLKDFRHMILWLSAGQNVLLWCMSARYITFFIGQCLMSDGYFDPGSGACILRMFERSTAKNCYPVSLLSVVSKVFEKLVNKKIVEHLKKCGFFSDFECGFRSYWSTKDLLTVVSDRIARAFKRSGGTRTVALYISKAFDRAWNAGLLDKPKSYGISGQIFGLLLSSLSSLLNNRWLQVVQDGKSSQKYSVKAVVPQGFVLGLTFFLLYINNLHYDVTYNIGIYSDDTNLYSKCDDQASDKWQQLELTSGLGFDLQDSLNWDRIWLNLENYGSIRY